MPRDDGLSPALPPRRLQLNLRVVFSGPLVSGAGVTAELFGGPRGLSPLAMFWNSPFIWEFLRERQTGRGQNRLERGP